MLGPGAFFHNYQSAPMISGWWLPSFLVMTGTVDPDLTGDTGTICCCQPDWASGSLAVLFRGVVGVQLGFFVFKPVGAVLLTRGLPTCTTVW